MTIRYPLPNILPGTPIGERPFAGIKNVVRVFSENGHYFAVDERDRVICQDSPTACIQEAINSIEYGTVFLGPGKFVVSQTITLNQFVALVGSGYNITLIREDPTRTANAPLISSSNSWFIVLKDLMVEGNRYDINPSDQNGVGLISLTASSTSPPSSPVDYYGRDSYVLLENVVVRNSRGHGIYISGIVEPRLINVVALNNMGHGFYLDAGDMKVVGCTSGNNGGSGFLILGNGLIIASKAYGSGLGGPSPNSPSPSLTGADDDFFITGFGHVILAGTEAGENYRYCYTIYKTYNVLVYGRCYDAGLQNDYTNGGVTSYGLNVDGSKGVIAHLDYDDTIRAANNLPIKGIPVLIQDSASVGVDKVFVNVVAYRRAQDYAVWVSPTYALVRVNEKVVYGNGGAWSYIQTLSSCSNLPSSGLYPGQTYVCYNSSSSTWQIAIWTGSQWIYK